MATWIYVRVSSKEQAADGGSLGDQARLCEDFVAAEGLELGAASNYEYPGVFADPGVSAWKVPIFERPGFIALWSNVQPGDTIVFLMLNRAFRTVADFSVTWPKFEKAGVTPVFVREKIDLRTASGKLIANILASFAQFKSDLISQRTKEGMAAKREREGGLPPKSPKQIQAANLVAGRLAVEGRKDSVDATIRGIVHRYVRVSTKQQEIASQLPSVNRISDRLVLEGYTEGELLEDHGVSAYRIPFAKRPSGKLIMERIKEGDVIAILRVDRMFRSIGDMANTITSLNERGVDIVTGCGIDTRTPFGRQCIEMLAMLASWESREISWRAKVGLDREVALRGKWLRSTKRNRPDWLKVRKLGDGTWKLIPDPVKIEQHRYVDFLYDEGLGRKEISEAMERRYHVLLKRPYLPPTKFESGPMSNTLRRRGCTPLEVRQFQYWVTKQEPDRCGEYHREWSMTRIHHVNQDREERESYLAAIGYVYKPHTRMKDVEEAERRIEMGMVAVG